MKASSRESTPVRLRLLTDHSQLIIEAWDRNPNPPQPRQADYADESGRGLNVIAAIARRWGSYSSGKWKVVWAEILTGTGQETSPGHLLAGTGRKPAPPWGSPMTPRAINNGIPQL